MGKSADWIKEEKFKSFFTQYYKELYYFACGYVKDTCIVEDIVSESFVKLWAEYGEYSGTCDEKIPAANGEKCLY